MWTPASQLGGERTGFTASGKAKALKAGETLFMSGSTDDHVYRVDDGEVGLYLGETLVARLGRESFVGAYAVLGEEPQPYTVKGLSSPATYLSAYPGLDVRNAFSANPELAAALAKSLDMEAAALELRDLEGESDVRLRILRAREYIKARRARIHDRLGPQR
ncbi:MAG: cyclic nucleotide-binding domain-containing protein [Acidobacteriota bacterium]